jgi:hypothetical protein
MMKMNLGLTHNSDPNSTAVTKHEMYFHLEGDGRCDTDNPDTSQRFTKQQSKKFKSRL